MQNTASERRASRLHALCRHRISVAAHLSMSGNAGGRVLCLLPLIADFYSLLSENSASYTCGPLLPSLPLGPVDTPGLGAWGLP
jgi:hypothetical protein